MAFFTCCFVKTSLNKGPINNFEVPNFGTSNDWDSVYLPPFDPSLKGNGNNISCVFKQSSLLETLRMVQ